MLGRTGRGGPRWAVRVGVQGGSGEEKYMAKNLRCRPRVSGLAEPGGDRD